MLKKLLSIFISSFMSIIMALFFLSACAGDDGGKTPSGNTRPQNSGTTPTVKFVSEVISDDACIITDYNGSDYRLTIPAKIDGRFVTAVGDSAFYAKTIYEVVFASDCIVDSIEGFAFSNCPNLYYIEVPSTVSYVADSAFLLSRKLVHVKNLSDVEITISNPDSEVIDGEGDFVNEVYKDDLGVLQYLLPSGNNYLFGYSGNSPSLDLTPYNAFKRIYQYAFAGATRVNSMTLSDNIVSIGQGAFRNLSNLTTVNLPPNLTRIEPNSFDGCEELISVYIPSTVVEIGDYAFRYCKKLATLLILDNCSLQTLGASAFYGCESLTDVKIPSRVRKIGDNAFFGCTAVKTLVFNTNVLEVIEHEAFCNLSSLTRLNVTEGVKIIEYGAFSGCVSLTRISLPRTLIYIDTQVFASCFATQMVNYAGNQAEWKQISISEDNDAFKVATVIYGS